MKKVENVLCVILVGLLCSITRGKAQTVVLSAKDSLPIESVTVRNQDFSISAISDENGRVDLMRFSPSDTLFFDHLSFQGKTLLHRDLPSKVYLLTDSYDFGEVLVSYTRWSDELENTHSGVARITPGDIVLNNPQTSADLLGSTGEVFVQKSQQGGGSPMIRGFAANRLLYSVDGVRMNTAIFRGGNLHNVIAIDPLSLSKVEVLLGSYSTIYGSDAIGGVMNFTTINPVFSSEGTALHGGTLARFSSANMERTGHVNLQISGEEWAYAGTYSRSDFGHSKMGSHGPQEYLSPQYVEQINDRDTILANRHPRIQIPTSLSQWSTLQKIKWRPSQNQLYSYSFYRSSSSKFGRYDRHLRSGVDGRPRYGRWDYGPMVWARHHWSAEFDLDDQFADRIKIAVAYQKFKESRITRNFQSEKELNRRESVDAYSLNIDLLKSIHRHTSFFYGLEWVVNDIESKASEKNRLEDNVAVAPSRYPESKWFSLGGYASLRHQWKGKHLFHLGLRYNFNRIEARFNPEFYPVAIDELRQNNTSLTGNIAYRWEVTKSSNLFFNCSTGFRAPNIDDVGKVFDSEPGSVVVPNTSLKPEYAYNGEVAWNSEGKKYRSKLSFFYTFLDHAMVRRDFIWEGRDSIFYEGVLSKVQALQNAEEAQVYGLQLFGSYRLPFNLRVGGQFNYQRGKEHDQEGNKGPMRHAAPVFGSLFLKYEQDKIEMELGWQFQEEVEYQELSLSERSKAEIYAKDDEGRPYSPFWDRIDFHANIRINPRCSAQLGVENIFDRRYRPYGSGLAAAGRNFIISLRAEW